MRFRQIRPRVKLDKSVLLEHLGFLVDRGLVEEQNLKGGKRAHVITDRVLSVLKVLVPLVREAQRIEVQNFERIENIVSRVILTSKKKPRWRLSDFIKIEVVEEEV